MSFQLRVISQAGTIVDEAVNDVVFPGSAGETGVLINHVRYSGIVETGILRYTTSAGKKALAVSGGFARFSDGVITIIADEVSTRDTAPLIPTLEKRRAELQQKILSANGYTPAWDDLRRELAMVEAQLDRSI